MMELVYFFFNDTATTEIYTLSLHDALPISEFRPRLIRGLIPNSTETKKAVWRPHRLFSIFLWCGVDDLDRKSTRLNSSHANISYAVFCLKKKNALPESATSRPARLSYQICV